MPYDDFYEVYKERYNIIKHQREIAKSEEIPSPEKYRLKLNSMQERFIANLRKILEQGEERTLLISATGAHVILMTGRKALIYKEFGPVFSIDAMYGWYCYDFISTDKRMYDII